jgi:hypothetical protein
MNPNMRMDFPPQSLKWRIPLYTTPQPLPDDTAVKMIAAGNRMAAMLDTSLTAPVEQWPDEAEIDAALKEWRFAVDPCPPAAAGKGIDAPQPQREWVGLTEHEVYQWWRSENGLEDCDMARIGDFRNIVRSVEAKLREKNAPELKVN